MSTMNRYRSIFTRLSAAPIVTALLFTSAFTATAVSAEPSSGEITLQYSRSDLSSPPAAETLYNRIQHAARDVCQEPPKAELSRYAAYMRCYRKALDTAVAKVDATQLTALHRSKTQRNTAS